MTMSMTFWALYDLLAHFLAPCMHFFFFFCFWSFWNPLNWIYCCPRSSDVTSRIYKIRTQVKRWKHNSNREIEIGRKKVWMRIVLLRWYLYKELNYSLCFDIHMAFNTWSYNIYVDPIFICYMAWIYNMRSYQIKMKFYSINALCLIREKRA